MSRVGNDMQSAATSFLDGTDCVMLSGESAMGRYPVESVEMLSRIAAEIEPYRTSMPIKEALQSSREEDEIKLKDLIALSVETALKRVTPPTLIVPTRSGATARSIARFKLPVWITAVSSNAKTCQNLMFSYGVFPLCETDHPENWKSWATNTIQLVYQSISFICWKSFNLNKKED